MTPKKIKPFEIAYKRKRKLEDERDWVLGQYILSAVSVSISHNFNKNSQAQYVKEPFFKNRVDEVSEEEWIEEQRQLFIAQMMTMEANFKANKKGGNECQQEQAN